MSDKCAIIGDMKKSRSLDNWPSLFRKLEKALGEINTRFSDDIVVNFTPTVGDEFQGAIITPEKAFEICSTIRRELQVDVRYGIGIGNIEKPFNREMGLRGSAFYRARDALEWCKKKNRNVFMKSSDAPNLTDDTINTLLHFIEALENSWTKRQQEIANYYRLHPDYTYEQLSKHFGFSKQWASQLLKGANWGVITEGEDLVNKLLEDMYLHEDEGKQIGLTSECKANRLDKRK